jgi:hypothetical protein
MQRWQLMQTTDQRWDWRKLEAPARRRVCSCADVNALRACYPVRATNDAHRKCAYDSISLRQVMAQTVPSLRRIGIIA